MSYWNLNENQKRSFQCWLCDCEASSFEEVDLAYDFYSAEWKLDIERQYWPEEIEEYQAK